MKPPNQSNLLSGKRQATINLRTVAYMFATIILAVAVILIVTLSVTSSGGGSIFHIKPLCTTP